MPDNQQFVTLADLGTGFEVDGVADEINVDAATIDVAAATNIAATNLLAALSELGGRVEALETP